MNRKQFLKTIGGGTLAMTLAPNLLLAENLNIFDVKPEIQIKVDLQEEQL